MLKSLYVPLCMVLVAPLASAEIFKCVTKDGTDLYQNFPCQFESMGWTPINAQSTKASPPPSDSNPMKAKAGPLAVETAGKSPALPTAPHVGMTTEEVRGIWGEPINSYQDELVDGRVEIWSYGASRTVQFDVKGRVTGVQR